MSFTDPKAYVIVVRDAILTTLRANKAALNANLTHTINTSHNDQIVAGDPRKNSPPSNLYPMIMVKLIAEEEDFEHLGELKRPTITFRVFALTFDETGQQDDEIAYLTRNLKGVLRDNMRFGLADSYVIYSNVERTDYGFAMESPSVFADVTATDLTVLMEVN